MTAPYLSDTPDILAGVHQHVIRVRAVHLSFGTLDLDVVDGSLSWDESRAPRAMLNVTVKAIGDPSQLDPRTGVRIEVDAGYRRAGGGEDVHTIANLGVRSVSARQPDGTLEIHAGGDEYLVLDASAVAYSTLSTADTISSMKSLLNRCLSPNPRVTATGLTGGAVSMDPVTEQWDTLNDLADQNDWKVYDDGLRQWVIEPAPALSTTPTLSLKVGEGGTIVRHDADTSRGMDWYNYVFLRYRWTDSAGVDKKINATAYLSDGDYSVTGRAGKRSYVETREVPVTQGAANNAAMSVLRRSQTRAESMSVEAVAAYWLRPGQSLNVTPRYATDFRTWLVRSVDFSLTSARMTIRTRVPYGAAPATVATTTPVAASPTADPTPPAKQTYVSRWVCNASRSYKGDGTENAFISPECAQGYYSGTNGNQRALFLFTAANSTGDETGQTITAALSGATVKAVRVRFKVTHTYANAGGSLRIGRNSSTALPATLTSATPYKSASVREGDRTWINITNSGLAAQLEGGGRGVTIGPGNGTDRSYYIKVWGASGSTPPEIEIEYAK